MRVLLSIVALVAALLAVEGLWPLFGTFDPLQHADAESVERALAYLQPCARVTYVDGIRRVVADASPTRLGFDSPLVRAPQSRTLRVGVVGESTGAAIGFALEDLSRRYPRLSHVEVLNCAESGSALEHVRRRSREVLGYDLDVLLVVFGHNLMIRYPTDRLRLRLLALRARSHALSSLAGELDVPLGSVSAAARAQRARELASWLEEVALQASRRETALVVTTLAGNLWMPHSASDRTRFDPAFLATRFAYAEGDHEDAIEALSSLVQSSPEPHWHFTLGTWLARAGRTEAASTQLGLAIAQESREPDRAPNSVNAMLRGFAAERGAGLFDMEGSMKALAPGGMPDWTVMCDNCHVHSRFIDRQALDALEHCERAARAAAPAAATVELPSPGPFSRFATAIDGITYAAVQRRGIHGDHWVRALAFAIERWAVGFPDAAPDLDAAVDAWVDGEAIRAFGDPRAQASLLVAVADGYWNAGSRERALAINARAREPSAAPAWVQLGLFRTSQHDPRAAAAAFDTALEIDPDRVDARAYRRLLEERGAAETIQDGSDRR